MRSVQLLFLLPNSLRLHGISLLGPTLQGFTPLLSSTAPHDGIVIHFRAHLFKYCIVRFLTAGKIFENIDASGWNLGAPHGCWEILWEFYQQALIVR